MRKVRRLKQVPDPDNAVGKLAGALRRSRAGMGLTQGQAADIIGTSVSTIQRAESGAAVPKRPIVEGYVTELGLDAEEAKRLFEGAIRPLGRQRRSLTAAPHPSMVSTADELGSALARVWEVADRPSMQKMEDRVQAARDGEAQKPFAFLSRSAAHRISHRQQLPSSIGQLHAYLYACGVKEGRFLVWGKAYDRVQAKKKEEAPREKADTEERGRWRGYRAHRLAEAIMLQAGLRPTEPFPHSHTAPWTARCVTGRHGIRRFRLVSVMQGHGCPKCESTPPRS
ncbi:helix-turn-helix transcriptional regulator (plasmid) [Streptomyces castrisilvae]|uniref:Helix-turn-helix transcriptional regulator n=1 Tax=Streptomyces castrisilvae TaxID=3033811 RepID=A0ABY9HVE2_9ACTN|nr:helix-turn-helix transcriptional regulator [Streptomyces sp. Mut1]WLQ38379.1 helix-turn-helix transcriptional regulator [Streptomyces sp. Mut1]